jgi:hypothetical protein
VIILMELTRVPLTWTASRSVCSLCDFPFNVGWIIEGENRDREREGGGEVRMG